MCRLYAALSMGICKFHEKLSMSMSQSQCVFQRHINDGSSMRLDPEDKWLNALCVERPEAFCL